ncbi:MFS transporter [Pseudomonas huanghezhanensis]|uniref:MFS transporter n=1 Tax=Pseudomonas huanghezhanensis TaxID=3002903 RepID=UPI002285FFC5|nr:MFS transporter [Pseudomonas sp. BSw22131]
MENNSASTRPGQQPWYKDISRSQWKVLAAAWGVWVMDALDFLAITFVLSDIANEFDVSLQSTSLLLLATYGVRWFGGLMFGGWSDRIGRKIPLLITLLWFTAGAVATGLAWSFVALVLFRLILGIGMAPGFSLGATMVAESWPEKHRAIGIGILDTGWGIGAIGAALAYNFVYPEFGWRGMFFVGLVPGIILGLFIAFMVPESEVWLRNRDALRSKAKEKVAFKDFPAIMLFRLHPGRVGYLAIMMLVLCFGSWPFQGLFPTYLKSLGTAAHVITWLTMTSAVGQVFGFFASGFIAERLGRRLGLGAMLGVGSLFVVALVYAVDHLPVALVCAFFSGFFLVGSSGIWGTILTENLPTQVRASGVGFLYNVGVIGGGVAPFIVLSTIDKLHFDIAEGIAGFTLLAALLAFVILKFVKETRGVSLHDVSGEKNAADEPQVVPSSSHAAQSPGAPL